MLHDKARRLEACETDKNVQDTEVRCISQMIGNNLSTIGGLRLQEHGFTFLRNFVHSCQVHLVDPTSLTLFRC